MIYLQIGYETIEINDFLLIPDDNYFSNYNTYKSFRCSLDDKSYNIELLRNNSNKIIELSIFQSNSYYTYYFENCYIMNYNCEFSINEPNKINLIVSFNNYMRIEDKIKIRSLKIKKLFNK